MKFKWKLLRSVFLWCCLFSILGKRKFHFLFPDLIVYFEALLQARKCYRGKQLYLPVTRQSNSVIKRFTLKSEHTLFPRGGGGEGLALNKVLYGEDQPQGPNPLPFTIDIKRYPFHIPSKENGIPFISYRATFTKLFT